MNCNIRNLFGFFITAAVLLTGCDVGLSQQEITASDGAKIKCINQSTDRICYESKNGLLLFEGDIIIGDANQNLTASSNIVPKSNKLGLQGFSVNTTNRNWLNRVVPYIISNDFSDIGKQNILAAMEEYRASLGFAFVPHTTEPDFVIFKVSTDKAACYSHVGRIGGSQEVQLSERADGCTVHELGHALGLYHEQSRPDRDQFITVHSENIIEGREYAFNIRTDGKMISGYDSSSVMHYSSTAFSSNGKPTITLIDGTTNGLDYKYHLSSGDIQALNSLYGAANTKLFFSQGDYNNDGKGDWSYYTPLNDDFVVLLSSGNGHFTEIHNNTTSLGNWSDARFFSTGDFNGDGKTDWSWYAPKANDYIVLLSTGDGHWNLVHNDTSGFGNWSDARFFSTGDFNGDGKTDWSWYAPWSNDLIVLLSTGNGHWNLVHNNTSGFGNWSGAQFFSTGDFNGDGRTDWSWYAPWTNDYVVLLSIGDGHWTLVHNSTAGFGNWSGAQFFSTGDFNGDKKTDWSWYAPWTNDYIVLLSTGDGHWNLVHNNTAGFGNWSGAQFFSTGDFNGDGRSDWSWYAPWSNDHVVLLSSGDGHWSLLHNDTKGLGNWSGAQLFSVGDYNGDGKIDWSWYASGPNDYVVLLSTGDGHWGLVHNTL